MLFLISRVCYRVLSESYIFICDFSHTNMFSDVCSLSQDVIHHLSRCSRRDTHQTPTKNPSFIQISTRSINSLRALFKGFKLTVDGF